MAPRFFKSEGDFRRWLEKNHDSKNELLLGFLKKHTGNPSITYPEALDLALCYGWIDGIRRSLGEESYTIRFTPRRSSSIWSLVNIRRVGELKRLRLMKPAGLAAFAQRDEKKAASYAYERSTREFDSALEKKFASNKKAWSFFQAQPPSYRRVATWFVMSAKKDETRFRRLATLIDASQKGRRITETLTKAKPKES